MTRILILSDGPESWQKFLAEPEKHWKTGYSAKSLAYSWEEADGFPDEIGEALNSGSEELQNLEPLLTIPEYKVPLPGGIRGSQNDVFVLAANKKGLASICIEGKVNESFDRLVSEWDPDASRGKRERFDYLVDLLDLTGQDLRNIRYQLLHRTASAIIEANRFHAQFAIMLVHSFSQEHMWYEDFTDFSALFGISPVKDHVHFAGQKSGVDLYLGWIVGNSEYLER